MTVIFDLDGTLVDSSLVLSGAINYVRNYLGLKSLPKAEIIEQINNPECNFAEYFYGLKEITSKHEELFKEYYYANHDTQLELFSGVEQMLQELKSSKIKIALATNAYRDSTTKVLNYLNLIGYFDTIACWDDVKSGKPSPDMLYKVIKNLNSKKAIFIGDSQRDLLASKAANIEFILVDFVNQIDNTKDLTKKIKNYLLKGE